MSEPRASRIGKRLGGFVASGINVAFGYLWAKHGYVYALEFLGIALVALLAVYGALTYPWWKLA